MRDHAFHKNRESEFRKAIDTNLELRKYLVSKKVWDDEARSKWSKTCWSPLHFAASCGHLSLIRCLIEEYCAHVDVTDKFGTWTGTPLHVAIWQKQKEAMELLLSLGANPATGGLQKDGQAFDSAMEFAQLTGGTQKILVSLFTKNQCMIFLSYDCLLSFFSLL